MGEASEPAEAIVRGLERLGPQARLPGHLLFSAAALGAAGLDADAVASWAQQHGGGPLDAGAVRLRKGQRVAEGRVGQVERFIRVPETALPALRVEGASR